MPNSARLFGLVGLALVAFFATEIYKTLLPEGMGTGKFTPINMLIGAAVGWRVLGRYAGHGWAQSFTVGLFAASILLFYSLFTWSFVEMIGNSMNLRYDGPVEALQAMVAIAIEYCALGLTDPQVPIALFVGGILAAFLAEWAATQARKPA